MEYSVIFDVGQSEFRNWCFVVSGLILTAISGGLFVFRRKLPASTPRFFPLAFLGFSSVLTAVAVVFAASASHLASALRDGKCEEVTGDVTNFHPMPAGGHDKESFCVGNRWFEFSDYMVSPGFNNTSSHGGPIREGLKVRIHHRGNDILRLEIAK